MGLEEELDKRIRANPPRLNFYQFIHELRLLTERYPREWEEFKKRHAVKP